MGPRAAIVLATLSAIGLCGCSALDESAEPSQDLGVPRSDLGANYDGAFCNSIVTITGNPGPDVPGGFLYAPTDLIATATSNTGSLEAPEWNVSLADGATFTPEVIDTASGLTVRFHAPVPGSYTFRVDFPNSGCRGESSVDVHSRDSKSAAYKLRISPPPSAGVPQQDQSLVIYGGTALGDHNLTLLQGTIIQATLFGPGPSPVSGEVRLLGENGPDALSVAGTNGVFVVAVNNDLSYTPLIIPSSSSLAPKLLAKVMGVTLPGVAYTVDAGQQVNGTVMQGTTPIAGARVVLRSGKLPSGTGISDGSGSFTLRAQPGDYIASIGVDGWPEVTVPSLTVPSTLSVQYVATLLNVSAKVLAFDGSPVSGARVTLRSPSLPSVATVNGSPAPGLVKHVVISGADGTLPPLALPPSSYDILIEPPGGAADGVTAQAQMLTTDATWTLSLQPKIVLAGTVSNLLGEPVGGARVTAFETAGLGAAPSTTSASDGTWELRVDSGSPMELLVEPPGASNLASARLGLPAGTTKADTALGPGLRVGGYVVSPSGGKLPSVVVDALCNGCGSDVPIASAISDGTGAYALYLPDPGVGSPDGGADLSP
jgi:hypothetical protein